MVAVAIRSVAGALEGTGAAVTGLTIAALVGRGAFHALAAVAIRGAAVTVEGAIPAAITVLAVSTGIDGRRAGIALTGLAARAFIIGAAINIGDALIVFAGLLVLAVFFFKTFDAEIFVTDAVCTDAAIFGGAFIGGRAAFQLLAGIGADAIPAHAFFVVVAIVVDVTGAAAITGRTVGTAAVHIGLKPV